MEIGVHLPQLDLDGSGLSLQRLRRTVDTSRALGFAAVSANDHLDFAAPWLDGLVALTAAATFAGDLDLMTSIALPVVRGPEALATALAGLAQIASGRVVAGVGPGSSARDYALVDKDFDTRWRTFDQAVPRLRALLDPSAARPAGTAVLEAELPIWIASWGSDAGLRRVARLGDGWVASAYNMTPELFAGARSRLGAALEVTGRAERDFPHALVTMWLWLTETDEDARQVVDERLAPVLGRTGDELRDKVCVGTVGHCVDLLARYADAGCRRVHVWPLGSEVDQLTRLARDVLPHVTASPSGG
jgi:alkanesulfonate monooxygenase SsuD/methylene tetrahydromethanopterin reductase-like flavin-dependent oxidoreductase (luciferase family)